MAIPRCEYRLPVFFMLAFDALYPPIRVAMTSRHIRFAPIIDFDALAQYVSQHTVNNAFQPRRLNRRRLHGLIDDGVRLCRPLLQPLQGYQQQRMNPCR